MADNRNRIRDNGMINAHINPDIAQEMRRIIPYIPHEIMRTFLERAIQREIDRYYEYQSDYHAGKTD